MRDDELQAGFESGALEAIEDALRDTWTFVARASFIGRYSRPSENPCPTPRIRSPISLPSSGRTSSRPRDGSRWGAAESTSYDR